ncbi:MAG: XdhC family protein [Candidatus Aminicenantales bacterium]
MERTKNIYLDLVRSLKKGGRFALGTIIEAKGSTPQGVGASALFSRRGLVLGTLGGGLVELEAHRQARESLAKGLSFIYELKLTGDRSSPEALCGGSVRVLMDAMPGQSLGAFELMQKSLHLRRPGVLITRIGLSSASRASIRRSWWEAGKDKKKSRAGEDFLTREELEAVLHEKKPRLSPLGQTDDKKAKRRFFFLEPLFPQPRLVIVGAGHIGQALAPLGKRLDFEVTVIDDRPEYARARRFPEADSLIVKDIEAAVRNFPISSDTYIVILTRGHRHDAEALRACIHSRAGYIGMIGSRRKVALMRQEFLEKGWATAAEFDRIHAPIGLKIGSKTVEEIAVSIAAELVLVRSRSGDHSLR